MKAAEHNSFHVFKIGVYHIQRDYVYSVFYFVAVEKFTQTFSLALRAMRALRYAGNRPL